jgi:hypothetical protein
MRRPAGGPAKMATCRIDSVDFTPGPKTARPRPRLLPVHLRRAPDACGLHRPRLGLLIWLTSPDLRRACRAAELRVRTAVDDVPRPERHSETAEHVTARQQSCVLLSFFDNNEYR